MTRPSAGARNTVTQTGPGSRHGETVRIREDARQFLRMRKGAERVLPASPACASLNVMGFSHLLGPQCALGLSDLLVCTHCRAVLWVSLTSSSALTVAQCFGFL